VTALFSSILRRDCCGGRDDALELVAELVRTDCRFRLQALGGLPLKRVTGRYRAISFLVDAGAHRKDAMFVAHSREAEKVDRIVAALGDDLGAGSMVSDSVRASSRPPVEGENLQLLRRRDW